MLRNEIAAEATETVPLSLSADQRNALYAQVRDDLLGIDDLRLAIEGEEFDVAERRARKYVGELRLVLGGLGWGDEIDDPVEVNLPAAELRLILTQLRDTAVELYESERPEQESFRSRWEQTALVRDTCDELLGRLPRT